MKVTDVKTFLVHPGIGKNWLFVKVETDAGVHGWGEAYTQADRDHAIVAHVKQMRRYLLGRDPFQIKHFTTVMYLDFAGKRGAMDFYSALSGLEQALWDIAGKALNVPVYNLLGGQCRDRIRVYANGWSSGADSPEETARKAVGLVEMGFTAMKWDPFPPPWRPFISRWEEQAAVASVRAVRDAVGPTIDLLVEVHRRLAPSPAVRVARMLEPFDPFWYEEPVSARDLASLARVHRDIQLPVVTGEELYTKAEFRPVFEQQAADIINPDVCNCGGILELKEIAAMAEPYHVAVAPHNYNSTTLGLAATIHAAAVMPNFLITEYFVNFEAVGRELAEPPFVVDSGYIALPTGPGLSLDLSEDALARYPYQRFPPRSIRHPADEGP
ncbi:MAG: mandelate racemase [Dehalococcoidia bacterium]|nr:mandelate racemase [Dehalococcoidia bacterium]